MKKIIPLLFSLFLISDFSHAQYPEKSVQNINKLTLNNLQIAYTDKGQGACIFFIHGLGGNRKHWKKNIEVLSKQYRCIAVDLPGYGHSDYVSIADTQKQLDVYAQIILGIIKQLKLSKVILAGHSMGGQIAVIAALHKPELFSKLLLIAPAGFETFTTSEASLLKSLATAAFYEAQDSVAIRKSFIRNFYSFPPDAEILITERLALQKCKAFSNYCQSVSAGVQGMLGHPVKDSLPIISLPTLVIFGDNDSLIPNKVLHPSLTTLSVADAGRAIKNVEIKMVASAGHMVQFEQAAAVNKIISDFIK